MRKLLMLMLVLGVASGAYAGFSISLHETDGVTLYDGRDLVSSDELWLDIDATSATQGEYAYWALVVESADGTISGGAAVGGGGNLNSVDDPTWGILPYYFVAYGGVSATASGVTGGMFDSGGAVLNGQQINQVLFHCEGVGDATVQLWLSPDFATYSMVDTAVISQIPEPMTMALLGLGGLLLRRRK